MVRPDIENLDLPHSAASGCWRRRLGSEDETASTTALGPSASPSGKQPKRAISSSGGGSQDHFRLGFHPHWRLSSAPYSARLSAAIATSITGTSSACSISL